MLKNIIFYTRDSDIVAAKIRKHVPRVFQFYMNNACFNEKVLANSTI